MNKLKDKKGKGAYDFEVGGGKNSKYENYYNLDDDFIDDEEIIDENLYEPSDLYSSSLN
jgi:hypothetical protein